MNRYLSRVWVMCVPVAVACSGSEEREPVSAASLALTAQQNVENALRGAHTAGSFVAESATLAKLLSAGTQSCESGLDCTLDGACTPSEPVCTDSVTSEDLAEAREDMADAIDDLVKTLREDVFVPANLESEDGKAAVYRLTPEFLCKRGDSTTTPAPPPGGSTQPTTAELDPECVEHANELQPRLRLTSPSEGDVDVALLLTKERRNPATLELHHDGIGAQIDLAEVKATLDASHQDTGSLASMSGKLQFELHRNADLDYSFRFNVLSSLNVNTVDDLMQQIALTLAGSKPSFELRLDGNARQVTGTYHFGAFGVKGPLNALYDAGDDDAISDDGAPNAGSAGAQKYTGLIDLLIGGFDGSVTFDGSRDRVELHALGLGDKSSTLKHDGDLIAQLDINPTNGRHFDLAMEKDDAGQTTLTFSPTLDVSVLLNFQKLKAQIADIPDYALNDTLRVFFNGTNPSVRTEKEQLRVLSGTLNVTSQQTPSANLSVPTGSCLFDSNAEEPAHELLGALASGTCK